MTNPLPSYQEALQLLETHVQPVPSRTVSWRDSLGTVLIEDVRAREDTPLFDNSSMDGFAVRSEDVQGAGRETPVSLQISDELFAGSKPLLTEVKPGHAVKIMTGAPIPPGADAVVMVEQTAIEGQSVLIYSPVQPGENVRPRGEEIKAGSPFLSAGTRIGSIERGLLASQGIPCVEVRPFPKVALFTSGDELVDPEEPLRDGQIHNANTYTLEAELNAFGCQTTNLGIIEDDPQAIRSAIEKALSQAQVVLTIGGVSAGEKDFIPAILAELGMERVFHRLSVKPGKPVLFGTLHKKYIFGLPGNVVSVLASYHLLVKPAIRLMAGQKPWRNPVSFVRLSTPLHNPGDRTFFVRCKLSPTPSGLPLAVPTGQQGSGRLTSMQQADGFAVVPADIDTVDEFEVLEFIPIQSSA